MNNPPLYLYFDIIDFKGSNTLSSYSLPITPLTFIPRLNEVTNYYLYSNKNILWNFGDGTTVKSLTAQHYYKVPGTYTVTCSLYDGKGEIYENLYSQQVTIFDYLPDKLLLKTASSSSYTLSTGTFSNPLTVITTNSWQNYQNNLSGYTVNLYASGCTQNFFDQNLQHYKYGHLVPNSSFYTYNNSEFTEVSSIRVSPTLLYCTLSGSTIINCLSSDNGSVLCGTSGSQLIYFKDFFPTNQFNIYGYFDLRTFDDHYHINRPILGTLNPSVIGISGNIVSDNDYYKFSITSTGLNGDGIDSTTFNISPNKFVGQKINFVVRVKDHNLFNITNLPLLTLSASGTNTLSARLVTYNGSSYIPLSSSNVVSNFTTYNTTGSGGYFQGYITPLSSTNNVYISCFGNVNGTPLSGLSNSFNVYPSDGVYNISKVNENFNWQQTMKDLCFQEFLLEKPILFDDFFGSIFGGLSANWNSLGVLAYEKTSNFATNQIDIDRCNVNALYSISEMMGSDLTRYHQYNFSTPANIGRIMDLVSIDFNKLHGETNKFNLNFNPRGHYNNDIYGTNLGSELDFNTTVLTAKDYGIVAQERFSGKFKLCNTNLLSTTVTYLNPITKTYPLSAYSNSWGWDLVLGNAISGKDILKYYTFYSYISTIQGSLTGNTIDFNNPLNTYLSGSSYQSWVSSGGVIENIFTKELYSNLNIL